MPRPRLQDDEIRAFRREVAEAGLDLVASGGVNALSFRRLAEVLGCSHAKPYRYFPSKDALLAGVRQEGFRRFVEHLEPTLDEDLEARERLHALGQAYFGFARSEPSAFAVMFGSTDAPGSSRTPEAKRAWKILAAAVDAALETGLITGDRSDITHLLWSSVHGITMLHLSDKLRMGRSAKRLLPQMIETSIDAHREDMQ